VNNNVIEDNAPYKLQQQTEPETPNVPSYTRGVPDEQRLMVHLFNGYERTVRPVRNASTPVVIRMGLTLTQIFDMVSLYKRFISFSFLFFNIYYIQMT
jgi:hypothetical protein